MIPLKHIKKIFRRMAHQLTWPTMFLLVLGQAIIAYILFFLAGESALTDNPMDFIYYNMVVVSTVGFGDFSPTTEMGKAIVAFVQIPSGLIVFAAFIGKATQLFINLARKNMYGTGNFYHYNDHILLLGWDSASTEQIVHLILGDKKRQKRQILLCVTEQLHNPFPDTEEVSFVRLRSFSDKDELNRIGLSNAKRIIIDGKSDDETLSIALCIATYTNLDANVSAHFFDKTKAALLKVHCPQIECSIDSSAQMMVRSMQDPGSSQVTKHLLSTLTGATLYCVQTPELQKPVEFEQLFSCFKSKYAMIVIAFSHFKNGDAMILNPSPDAMVKSGDFLHFIANERITADEINWDELY